MNAWRLLFPLWCTFFLTSAFAGHGFMTTFGNIEWLPNPGRAPDSPWYRLDGWDEEGRLLLTRMPEERVRLCLSYTREKLAELEAMVKAENAVAAKTAANHYRLYLERALQITAEESEPATKESLAELMANALLEHQYILSVIYPDLPSSPRAVVLQVIAIAQEHYQDVTKLLPPRKKGALFFKEEEVRWSVQMAMRADEESSQ
jgi:Domain of unknown function (DUF5667)